VSPNDRYAKEAASRIQRAWRVGLPRLSSAPRDSIASAERALRGRRRRRVLVRRVLPALLSSVVVGGLAFAWLSGAPRPTHGPAIAADVHALMLFKAAQDPAQDPMTAGAVDRPLGAGDQVFAPLTASVRLGDTAGTQLTLEPGGMLTVVESAATRRFALRRGAVVARVRKLAPGERFIIETADAEIEVHGTEFRVAVGEPESVPCTGAGPRASVATRVSVAGGVVSVKWSGEEQRLRPGDEWPPRCAGARTQVASDDSARAGAAEKPAIAPSAESLPPSRPVRHHASRGGAGLRPVAPASAGNGAAELRSPQRDVPASVLAAQNDLFISAVRARRAGQNARALALFERFMRDYPDASLFESALVHKMRLLAATSDLPAASASARQYLARFPDGFARDEARALLGTRPQP
jgi:ferric-dicitrate binding protein FerR (iron transport regulator)